VLRHLSNGPIQLHELRRGRTTQIRLSSFFCGKPSAAVLTRLRARWRSATLLRSSSRG